VNVHISDQPGGLCFAVADDGPGFEPTRASSQRGISGMRDRIEALGGHFKIVSHRGLGTCIHATIREQEAEGSDPTALLLTHASFK